MEYEKPYMTLDELADRLISRTLSADSDTLIEHLRNVGYFRLSDCWNTLKFPDGTFRDGTNSDEVWRLYTFDRQFRLCSLDVVERVEVWLRATNGGGSRMP